MPGDRLRGRGGFPFKLRGQPFARPLRICRGLIKADMGDRLVRIDRLDAVEREYSPVSVLILEPVPTAPSSLGRARSPSRPKAKAAADHSHVLQ